MTISILKTEAFQPLGPAIRKEPVTGIPTTAEEWKPLREGYEREVHSGQVRRADYERLQPRPTVPPFASGGFAGWGGYRIGERCSELVVSWGMSQAQSDAMHEWWLKTLAPTPDPEGWIKWEAKENSVCPVAPNAVVEVSNKHGVTVVGPAILFTWRPSTLYTITAYRVIES